MRLARCREEGATYPTIVGVAEILVQSGGCSTMVTVDGWHLMAAREVDVRLLVGDDRGAAAGAATAKTLGGQDVTKAG